MRFVYFCDSHIKSTPPISRIDNYEESILEKIRECFEYATEKNAVVIIGGDIFHTSSASIATITRFVDLCGEFSNLQFHCVIGNHDITGHQLSTVDTTTLGLLNRFFIHLTPPEGDIDVKFLHYTHDIEEMLAESGSVEPCDMLVNHAMITEEGFFGSYIRYKDVHQDAHVCLCSHYHPGFGIKQINGTVFVAPGAIARGALTQDNITRVPSFVYGDITKTKINSLKIIPLECAKPAEEVFNLNINTIEETSNETTKSIDSLKEFIFEGLNDPVTIVREVGKELGTEQLVLQEAIKRINET
jgi:hypothetical protein